MSKLVPLPCSCTSVRKVSRVLTRAYDAALQPAGLNATQFAVMRAIKRHPGKALMAAANDLQMERTSFYRSVNLLKKKGWLIIAGGPDKRSSAAEITSDGEKVLESAAPHWEKIQSEIVYNFGEKQWQTFTVELQRLQNSIPELSRQGGNNEASE